MQQLLSAAFDVFLIHGFSGTSLDDIARTAHVAKRTIYERFGSKGGLFAAAVQRSATELVGRFPKADRAGGNLGNDLEHIGRAVLEFVLQPKSLAIYRLVVGEAQRQPGLAHQFYENGPARAVAAVADLLAVYLRRNGLPAGDAIALARQFIGLVVLEVHQRAVLGTLPTMSTMAVRKHVEVATKAFLSTLSTLRPTP